MARVLVIEDNNENLELMCYLLEAFGHATLRAADGRSGIEAARRERPDLVLCDVHLPRVDGYGVARALKADADLAATPVVAVTALAMVGDRERGLAAGFDGYIAKPIEPERFVAHVERWLPAGLRSGVRPVQAEETRAGPAVQPAPRARVLVVDDSATNRELIRATLEPFGYRVSLADGVASGLALAASSAPDLILSDLHMPGGGGFDFVRAVKADPRLASLPFVFITSSVWGDEEREQALALGVSRFLLRPIEPAVLLHEIARQLESAGTTP